jgi:Uma2 family endonuclease
MTVVPTRLTLEEFLRLPEEEPSLEYDDGAVTPKVSPKGHHSALQTELIKQLDQSGLPRKLARAFAELRVTFGGASFVPDVSVYRWSRIPVEAGGRLADDFLQPPDIAVEIVSPGQSVNALNRRCLWYVEHGVQVALLVDPVDESVLAFRPGGSVNAWRGSEWIDLSEVLPDFALAVDQLFASLRHM